jgi:hypothetical protein
MNKLTAPSRPPDPGRNASMELGGDVLELTLAVVDSGLPAVRSSDPVELAGRV